MDRLTQGQGLTALVAAWTERGRGGSELQVELRSCNPVQLTAVSRLSDLVTVLSAEAVRADTAAAVVRVLVPAVLTLAGQ